MSDVGKTFDELKRQNPSFNYVHADGWGFAAECFGNADPIFAYYFYGTHDGPDLSMLAPLCGDQLKCAGIYTTVGNAFDAVKDGPLPLRDFFSSIGVGEYEAIREPDNEGTGWIFFPYKGYSVSLNASCQDSQGNLALSEQITKDQPIFIVDDRLASINDQLCEKERESLNR